MWVFHSYQPSSFRLEASSGHLQISITFHQLTTQGWFYMPFWCSLRTWLNPYGLFWRGTVDPDILFICWAMGVLKRFIELKFLGIYLRSSFLAIVVRQNWKSALEENPLVNYFPCTDVGYYRKYKKMSLIVYLDWDWNQVLCHFFDSLIYFF